MSAATAAPEKKPFYELSDIFTTDAVEIDHSGGVKTVMTPSRKYNNDPSFEVQNRYYNGEELKTYVDIINMTPNPELWTVVSYINATAEGTDPDQRSGRQQSNISIRGRLAVTIDTVIIEDLDADMTGPAYRFVIYCENQAANTGTAPITDFMEPIIALRTPRS